MSDPSTIRIPVWPTAAPKPHTAAAPTWPPGAIVYAAKTDVSGNLELAWLVESFLGRVVAEFAVAADPDLASELAAYVRTHRASVLAGCLDDIALLPTSATKMPAGHWDGLGYRIRKRSLRSGDALVVCGMDQLVTMSTRSVPSRKHPDGSTLYLVGLVKPDGKPFSDSAGITIRRAGERFIATWTGGTWLPPKAGEGLGRGMPRRGPIVDVLNVATSLRGVQVDELDSACDLSGVKRRQVTGDRIVDLRSQVHAIARLFACQVREARGMDLDLNLAFLVSTAGIGTAIFREANL